MEPICPTAASADSTKHPAVCEDKLCVHSEGADSVCGAGIAHSLLLCCSSSSASWRIYDTAGILIEVLFVPVFSSCMFITLSRKSRQAPFVIALKSNVPVSLIGAATSRKLWELTKEFYRVRRHFLQLRVVISSRRV